ncbi:hypothetical protein CFBP1573P_03056 [Pseudomonas syringae pv. persicae]|uniref:Uncharacterized protein n=2 Tax=root TaxID=1 RepID=A0AB38EGW4_9PSED|nr:hypothetical protein CFBP1573P_03056 [Pseudomonas syringae pv. persicae]SOQ11864.1 hypothetical protein NCPPB2254_03576 [Pseudomonas syringae pv. persicae]
MQCRVEDCGRSAMYQAAQLCQMHYFRVMRNGTTEKLTAEQWARDPRVLVSGATIRARKRAGKSDFDALFAAKITHNGRARA